MRATVGTERMPAFSMMVRKPQPGDPAVAARIREAAAAYLTTGAEIEAQQDEGRKRAGDYQQGVEDIRKGQQPAPKPEPGPGLGRDRTRSKHFQPPAGSPQPDEPGEDEAGEDDGDAGEAGGGMSEYRRLLAERNGEGGENGLGDYRRVLLEGHVAGDGEGEE